MNLKKKLTRDLFVMDFVQFVSSPQSHSKRVRKIKKTMQLCPDNLTSVQWMKLWRGFYYTVWYTEMRKGGEELIEEIGLFENGSYLLSGFKSLSEAWGGIDAFRIDKYMFLVRIMLRNVLKQLLIPIDQQKVIFENNIFLIEHKKTMGNQMLNGQNKLLIEVFDYIVTVTSSSIGFFLHICDIFWDELQMVLPVDISKASVFHDILLPFAMRLSTIKDDRLRKTISENIFNKLSEQVLIPEPVSTRIETFEKLLDSLTKIAAQTESGKNRNCLYSFAEKYRSYLSSLKNSSKDRVKLKRKIAGVDRKTKKIKYEIGTSVPFTRSIVPLPLI